MDDMITSVSNMLLNLKDLKLKLKQIKEKEMNLRKELAELFLKDIPYGTLKKFKVGNIKVKVKQGLNYSIDEKVLPQLLEELTDDDQKAIRVKHELNLRDYKKLPEDSILHEAVTSKPATPELEVEVIE